eukprot:2785821-Pyramimonas_sp.AAC.1
MNDITTVYASQVMSCRHTRTGILPTALNSKQTTRMQIPVSMRTAATTSPPASLARALSPSAPPPLPTAPPPPCAALPVYPQTPPAGRRAVGSDSRGTEAVGSDLPYQSDGGRPCALRDAP